MASKDPLPPGWTEYETENGTAYFHHDILGTQWDRPKQTEAGGATDAKPPSNTFDMATDQSWPSFGDEFVNSISTFFSQGGSTNVSMEGNLRGGDATPSKGFFGRAMSLEKYFQLTGDEFVMRCMSVFTILQGIFNSSGSHVIQTNMYVEKPDFFSTVWVTLAGASLLGFLPNVCESIITGRKSDFLNYNSALVAFALFPIGGCIAYFTGIVAHRRQGQNSPMTLQLNSASSDDNMVNLATLLCVTGYAAIPLVIALPALMLNSWVFRLFVLCITAAVSIGFLYVILKGSTETLMNIPSPRKVQFMVLAIMVVMSHMSVMLKLPTLAEVPTPLLKAGEMRDGLSVVPILEGASGSNSVEEVLANDNLVEAFAEKVKDKLEVNGADESVD